jgi:hypothetical protein
MRNMMMVLSTLIYLFWWKKKSVAKSDLVPKYYSGCISYHVFPREFLNYTLDIYDGTKQGPWKHDWPTRLQKLPINQVVLKDSELSIINKCFLWKIFPFLKGDLHWPLPSVITDSVNPFWSFRPPESSNFVEYNLNWWFLFHSVWHQRQEDQATYQLFLYYLSCLKHCDWGWKRLSFLIKNSFE